MAMRRVPFDSCTFGKVRITPDLQSVEVRRATNLLRRVTSLLPTPEVLVPADKSHYERLMQAVEVCVKDAASLRLDARDFLPQDDEDGTEGLLPGEDDWLKEDGNPEVDPADASLAVATDQNSRDIDVGLSNVGEITHTQPSRVGDAFAPPHHASLKPRLRFNSTYQPHSGTDDIFQARHGKGQM